MSGRLSLKKRIAFAALIIVYEGLLLLWIWYDVQCLHHESFINLFFGMVVGWLILIPMIIWLIFRPRGHLANWDDSDR